MPERVRSSCALALVFVLAPGHLYAAPAEGGESLGSGPADAPVEAEDAPVEAEDAPVEAEDAPVEAEDVPVEAEDVLPMASEKALPTGSVAGLDVDEAPMLDSDYDPTRDSPEALAARRWLGAGIGAGVSGLLLVGGALAMGLSDPCAPSGGNNCFVDARDRAAWTMGIPGAVLLLGGIAMTSYGALTRRKLRLGLAWTPELLGVVVGARF